MKGFKPKVDYPGAIVMALSIVTLLLALVFGGKEFAWTSWQELSLLVAAAAGIILFLLIEQRANEPMLPLSLFKKRVITVVSSVTFMQGIAMMGGATYIPLFVQGVLGGSAANAGSILTPMMLSLVAGSMSGGFAMRKFAYRPILIAAMTIMSVGAFLLTTLDQHSASWLVVLYMIIFGFGIGPLMPVTSTAVQAASDPSQRGVAMSSVVFFRSIGGTIGVTIMGVIVANGMTRALADRLGNSPLTDTLAKDPQVLLQPEARASIPAPILNVLQTGLTDAIQSAFLFALAAALLGLGISFFFGKSRLESTQPKTAQPMPDSTL
jgi:predicted MFS family arabinose efflux permease